MKDTIEIYLDGELVDVSEDTELTLEIKSNFFTDIGDVECNRTWTVKLPKTVRNMSLTGLACKLGTKAAWVARYHDCEYRKNGIPIITGAKAALTECEDGIAMVIYWGIFRAVNKLQETDMKLNELESDARLQFNRKNEADTYEQFTERGYGYADYNEQQAGGTMEGWTGCTAILTNKNQRAIALEAGKKTETGTQRGDRASLTPTTDTAWKSVIVDFPTGTSAQITACAGTVSYRAWAILAEDATVLDLAEDNAETTVGANMSANPSNVLGGKGAPLLLNYPQAATVKSMTAWLDRDTGERTFTIGYVTAAGQKTTIATRTVPKNWQGDYTIEQEWQKPQGAYAYVEVSTQSLGMYWTTRGTSGTLKDGQVEWTPEQQAMMSITVVDGTPEVASWFVDAPVGSAFLIVNHKTEAGAEASLTLIETPIEQAQPWQEYKAIQPSVTLAWINQRIEDKLQLAITMPADLEDEMKRIAVPLVSQETDGETLQDTELKMVGVDKTVHGIVDFRAQKLPAVFDVTSETSEGGSQLTVTQATKVKITIRADVSFETSNLTFYDAGGGNMETYTFNELIRMGVEDTDYYIGGDGYKTSCMARLRIREADTINGRYGMRIYGEGIIDMKAGDRVRLFFEHGTTFDTDKQHIGLRLENIIIEGEIQGDGSMPYGGWYPLAKNLPDIALTDYVRFLALVTGTFVRQGTGENELRLTPYTDITTENAVDWTEQLIPATADTLPRKLQYTMDGWAQNNRYKWKEDDTVLFNHDGNIHISNETLEWERTAWELPFAASDADRVPIREPMQIKLTSNEGYVKQEISGYDYEQCEPRVMNVTAKGGKAALVFDIDLNRIFQTRYKPLLDIVKEPRVITERFYLTDLEIMAFDETRPVYLKQYGQYFIVSQLTVNAEGWTEAELIQINK